MQVPSFCMLFNLRQQSSLLSFFCMGPGGREGEIYRFYTFTYSLHALFMKSLEVISVWKLFLAIFKSTPLVKAIIS